MDRLTKKTLTTSRSLTYTYYDTGPASSHPSSKPPLFLLHGFPDSAHLFKHVLPHLLPLGHRILIPDQLGHGTTSKPRDPALFSSKSIAADHAEILRSEEIASVIVIGHDWGAFSAQRLYLWHPELVAGLGMLNVAYMPPSATPLDFREMNRVLEEKTGYPRCAYWELFTAPDGAAVVDAHREAFWKVLHGERAHWMREMFCVRGAMREFLLTDGAGYPGLELRPYARPGKGGRAAWRARLEREGGLASALCWYEAMAGNHHWEMERKLPAERVRVTVPVFFLGCERDDVCLPEVIEQNRKEGVVGEDVTVEVIDAVHWCTMEKPDEVGRAIQKWLAKKF